MGKLGNQSLLAGILSIVIFFSVTYFGGTFAMVLNAFLALAAIIVGSIGIRKPSEKTKSIIGLILGVLTIVIAISLYLV